METRRIPESVCCTSSFTNAKSTEDLVEKFIRGRLTGDFSQGLERAPHINGDEIDGSPALNRRLRISQSVRRPVESDGVADSAGVERVRGSPGPSEQRLLDRLFNRGDSLTNSHRRFYNRRWNGPRVYGTGKIS
jgi:hypothetical protein